MYNLPKAFKSLMRLLGLTCLTCSLAVASSHVLFCPFLLPFPSSYLGTYLRGSLVPAASSSCAFPPDHFRDQLGLPYWPMSYLHRSHFLKTNGEKRITRRPNVNTTIRPTTTITKHNVELSTCKLPQAHRLVEPTYLHPHTAHHTYHITSHIRIRMHVLITATRKIYSIHLL